MVVDAGTKEDDEKDTLRSERRSALKKDLTESALSEMSGDATQSGPSTLVHEQADSAVLV